MKILEKIHIFSACADQETVRAKIFLGQNNCPRNVNIQNRRMPRIMKIQEVSILKIH